MFPYLSHAPLVENRAALECLALRGREASTSSTDWVAGAIGERRSLPAFERGAAQLMRNESRDPLRRDVCTSS
jgi:hypothetical protein